MIGLIYSTMAADSGIAALVGNRIFPRLAPANTALPYIVYFLVSGVGHHDIPYDYPRYQFSCFAGDYDTSRAIAAAVKDCWRGRKEGLLIQGVILNELDMPFADDTYGTAVDVQLLNREV